MRFADRLLAESVRALEETQPDAAAQPAANLQAVEAADGSSFEARITARAAAHTSADRLRNALRHTQQGAMLTITVGVIVAALAGAGATRAALGLSADRVNIFWAIAGLLGIQTLLLLAWAVAALIGPRVLSTGSLGGLLVALWRRMGQRVCGGRGGCAGAEHQAALRATANVFGRGRIGAWTFSTISHALWTAFNLACLAVMLAMLSGRHYTFAWETTILPSRAYVSLTEVVATLPSAVGFPTPDREQIEGSEWPGATHTDGATQRAWAGLLVGSMVTYGLGPRVALLVISLGFRLRAMRRYRLDTSLPGYARLRPILAPSTETIGVIDEAGDESPHHTTGDSAPSAAARPIGPPAALGLEIERPESGWPLRVGSTALDDLGFVDDRDDRRRVLDDLRNAETEPAVLLIVCSLMTTPDRGIAGFVEQAGRTITRPVRVVLTGGERCRQRDADVAQRGGDWREALARVGVEEENIVELDLDHLTDTSERVLAELVGVVEVVGVASQPARRIEEAFDVIASHADAWRTEPGTSEQAELHRAIARLYQHEMAGWRDLLHVPSDLKKLSAGDVTKALRTSAERMTSLLPDRLKQSPKWLAAGAAAGALGCVAAATLAAPIAITALPAWAGMGAAIAGLWKLAPKSSASKDIDEPAGPPDLGGAVRAAALFAMLLELQGRGEATISRVLDRAVTQDDEQPIESASHVQPYLTELRHRFDMALASEVTS